jgi:hypothetical protein
VEIMPVTTITSPLPEHSLRHRDETAVSTSGMDVCRLPASVGILDPTVAFHGAGRTTARLVADTVCGPLP